MDVFLQNLQSQFPLLVQYQNVLFFLGAALEGLNTMVLAGFLTSIGNIDGIEIFIVLVAGYCANGYLWYAVGYWGGARPIDFWLKRHKKRRAVFERVREYLERHTGRAIVITKTTLSFTIITLILAGFIRYNLKKFSWYNFLGSVAWVGVTFSVGYFFGKGFGLFFEYFRNVSYLILFFVAAAALVYWGKTIGRKIFSHSLVIAEQLRKVGKAVQENLEELVEPIDTGSR